MSDFTVEKVSETEGKIITPQPNKEEVMDVAKIKQEIEYSLKDIANYEATILLHQNKIAELQALLSEFEKAGIVEKVESEKEIV
jgi:hypothetical protein